MNISNKSILFKDFYFIFKLAFYKYKMLYFIFVASVFSIAVEFSAIGLLGLNTQQFSSDNNPFEGWIEQENIIIVFVFLFLIRFLSMLFLESSIVYYAKELQVYLSSTALSKVMNENIKNIEENEIGHYMALAGDEASNASQILIAASGVVNSIILIIAYTALVIIFSSNVIPWLIGLLLVVALAVNKIYKLMFVLGHKQALMRRKTNSIFVDALNSLRIVKSFSLESFMANEYHDVVSKYFSINSRLAIYGICTKYLPLIMLFVTFETYLIFRRFYGEGYDITFLVTLLFMLIRLLHGIGSLSSLLGDLIGKLKGISNIVAFINEYKPEFKKLKLTGVVNEIRINNASFAYDKKHIFTQLNLSFKAGGSYAIYGESGVGKSTLLDLIMGFISTTDGEVLINGLNVDAIEEKSLTKKIIYVGQDSLVFNKSIRENIELDSSFDNESILNAMGMVQLQGLINSLKNGIDYVLYYKGTNISGGQRQRINIARALIRHPDVLILDEATSALDPETKDGVIKNILKEFKDKIIIFVTHDTVILSYVDNVINLEKHEMDLD
ncbi:MAG: ABC-type bacteriocin/lantibiotic exporter with double-glycine peptidase domain [Flavobacteriaceae bacterium]|jgi:ABC-type bacteriocin/lantibiotic exporter with double-glycine peptidase domain